MTVTANQEFDIGPHKYLTIAEVEAAGVGRVYALRGGRLDGLGVYLGEHSDRHCFMGLEIEVRQQSGVAELRPVIDAHADSLRDFQDGSRPLAVYGEDIVSAEDMKPADFTALFLPLVRDWYKSGADSFGAGVSQFDDALFSQKAALYQDIVGGLEAGTLTINENGHCALPIERFLT